MTRLACLAIQAGRIESVVGRRLVDPNAGGDRRVFETYRDHFGMGNRRQSGHRIAFPRSEPKVAKSFRKNMQKAVYGPSKEYQHAAPASESTALTGDLLAGLPCHLNEGKALLETGMKYQHAAPASESTAFTGDSLAGLPCHLNEGKALLETGMKYQHAAPASESTAFTGDSLACAAC